MAVDLLNKTFRLAREGDKEAFAAWMGMVEIPLRRSLGRFARGIDVEAALQETLVRMWLVARDPGRVLEGDHASLKFAYSVARYVALEEMRRYRQDHHVPLDALDGLPEGSYTPSLPDPALRQAITACIERLPAKPRHALSARLRNGTRPDRELAVELRMRGNTFLQNIVRARKLLRACLERSGVRVGEVLS
jgi:DNA-directed RNA polymerase specialized sigma24 family protein